MTQTDPGPTAAFPGFYGNPAIGSIADRPRWTVSDLKKRPLAIRPILDAMEADGPVMIDDVPYDYLPGAFAPTAKYLVTLDELARRLPKAANTAFFLDAVEDELTVLDIEPSCPPELSEELLRLPALYREKSMSGKGYHLLLPLPAMSFDNPFFLSRPKLQDKHRRFEILQRHYVTFTRDVVDAPDDLLTIDSWNSLYERLASRMPASNPVGRIVLSGSLPEHPLNDVLLAELVRPQMKEGLRPLSDFGGDHSQHEFSAIGKLVWMLRYLEASYDAPLDLNHETWLVYEALRQLIPPRPKHNQLRGSLPLLLDRVRLIISINNNDSTETKETP